MSERHAEIAKALSPEAKRALIDTHEDQPVALPPYPLGAVVRQELILAVLIHPGLDLLTVRGEVVREYVLEMMLP
jgi:hypothetical protein